MRISLLKSGNAAPRGRIFLAIHHGGGKNEFGMSLSNKRRGRHSLGSNGFIAQYETNAVALI